MENIYLEKYTHKKDKKGLENFQKLLTKLAQTSAPSHDPVIGVGVGITVQCNANYEICAVTCGR
jgi:hypothetical protein